MGQNMKTSNWKPFHDDDLRIPDQAWGIVLISILGLFLELVFVRWISTEIRIYAYLQNTILVVCFLGLGLGMFTASKPIELRQCLIPMTFLLLLMAVPVTRAALGSISEMLSVLGDLVIWFDQFASNIGTAIVIVAIGLALTYFVLAILVDMFIPLGRILGRLMNAHPNPIWAYSVNIFGSVIGTWALVLLSYFYQPPFVWFLIAGGLILFFLLWTKKDRRTNIILLSAIIILSWFAGRVPTSLDVIWSPYQKLVVAESKLDEAGEFTITVNNAGYQAIIDLSQASVQANPERYAPELRGLSQYDLPALFHPRPESVLIVGAGTGNDVAGALRHNVKFVTAVEIDPAIIAIGRNLHPERPYFSPNVQVINDDARSFFATTAEKYDVISFGLLDSHTTTSMTNARLDHYVYTLESIRQAKSRLKDGGVMVLSFEAQKPFIADRIRQTLKEVFNQEPLAFVIPNSFYGWGGVMFVVGDSGIIQKQLEQNHELSLYVKSLQKAHPIQFTEDARITTDDWPYIYLESPKIPSLYYLLIGLMILLFIRSSRKWEANIAIAAGSRTFWHFFFLGAAFLLLEVQNISKASVVLGNTWEVNVVIISSILGMALLANWITYKSPNLPLPLVYTLLIGTCLGLYFVDLARFGFLPYFTKAVLVGSLTSLPMLFSGIVFTRSFTVADEKSNALGANLIGALVGALLQSITFITGIKSLLLLVALFYVLSLVSGPRSNTLHLSNPMT
jgi:spermidine synthase